MGRDPVRRKTEIRRIRRNSSHTFQIRERFSRGDASILIGASEMCGCGFFLSFLF